MWRVSFEDTRIYHCIADALGDAAPALDRLMRILGLENSALFLTRLSRLRSSTEKSGSTAERTTPLLSRSPYAAASSTPTWITVNYPRKGAYGIPGLQRNPFQP